MAYTNGGDISQTVGATATPGVTYTLQVALGLRNDGYSETGAATLIVDGHSVVATGVAPTLGNWSTYTASYTATAADAGGAISIDLTGSGPQADFDNVSLVSSVPEPASWTLMILGAAALGGALRRRRASSLPA